MSEAEVADQVVDGPSRGTALSPLSPLERIKAGLVQLATEAKPFDVTTSAGEKAARVFRAKCVSLRTAVDEAYETVNRPLLAVQRDARALRDDVKAQVAALEEPVNAQIKAEEARREVERIRKAEVEASRIAALHTRIDEIKAIAARAVGKPSAEIEQKIQLVVGMTIGDTYQELKPAAEQAQAATLATLRELLAAALVQEENARQLAAERAELARRRAAQDEAERVERERQVRLQLEADERIARERAEFEAEKAAMRAAQERIDAQARAEREAADRQAAAERAEADRVARVAREAEEQRLFDERTVLRREQQERDRQVREETEARERQAREAREAEERTAREAAEAEERRQAEIRAEQRRKEERAAIADKQVRDAAPRLLTSLKLLLRLTKSMSDPDEDKRPTDEELDGALAEAQSAIDAAEVVDGEFREVPPAAPVAKKRAAKSRT